MTTTPSLTLSEDEQIENLMAPTNMVGGPIQGKATAPSATEAGEDLDLDQEEEGQEAESIAAEEKQSGATDAFGMTGDNAHFAAMLAEVQQEPTEEMARYVQAATAQQQHQARMLSVAQHQQAAAMQQYQAQQHALLQQQQLQQPQLTMEIEDPEDSDDDGNGRSEKRAGRRKIRIEYIEDKSRRHITFSKRKAGIMKKAYELSTLTGTQVLLLVASETGHVYTFATPKLQPLITKPEGKNLIQACLNAPDGEYAHGGYDNEEVIDDRPIHGNVPSGMGAISQNYAAAMAGLAGYQYPQQGSNTAAAALAQAYMNQQAAHYPAYAAQYNAAAAAAGYWPQGTGSSVPQSHDRAGGAEEEGQSGETSGQH